MLPVQNYRVLLVDDEQNVLNALRRELTTPPLGHNHYEVEAYTSAAEALERAKVQSFDLVVSDYLMPGMDGLTFLKAFAAIQPDAARIIISGQADNLAIREAINDSHIYRFITKPWHDYYLKGSISQALAWRKQVLENRQLADRVRALNLAQPLHDEGDFCQVAVVDDDESVTNAIYRELTHPSNFQGIFGAMRYEATGESDAVTHMYKFVVYTFSSPQKALQAAKEMPFHCVISDYRMPELNGIEFLQQWEAIQPDCAKIMMSAYTDMEILLGAINDAHVFSFFNKPWNEFELKSSIVHAISQRRLLMENRMLASTLKLNQARGFGPT